MYFPTLLCILCYLNPSPRHERDEVLRRKVTFAEWEKRGDARPVQYPSISCGVIEAARSCGSVFARKFTAAACPAEEWERVVEESKQHVAFAPADSEAGNFVRQYGVTALSGGGARSSNNSFVSSYSSGSGLKKRKLEEASLSNAPQDNK